MAERWTEYAVMDIEDNEVIAGPFASLANAEKAREREQQTGFFGPLRVVKREMSAGDWTYATAIFVRS